MKQFIALLFSTILLITSAGCRQHSTPKDQDSLTRIQTNGKFIVGLDDSFPPMGYRDSNNEIIGFDIDLAREVAKKLNVEVEFQPIVWDNIVQEINSRNVDIVWNGCTITPNREVSFDFSEPYVENKQIVAVLQNSNYQTLEDLADKKAAIQDGSSARVALDHNETFRDSLGEIVGYGQNDRALLDLVGGGVDCVIVDSVVLAYYDKIQPNIFRVLPQDLGSEEMGIAFHKGDDSFREAVQQALNDCEAEGITAKLEKKWLSINQTKE